MVHAPTVHAEAAQPSAVVLARAQTVPHAPQLEGSIAVLAQYAVDPAPQEVSGEAHVVVQAPREQTWPAGQVIPHAPQLALSDWRLASHPSTAEWLQSAKPGLHAVMPQAPTEQADEALARVHARPQAPQLVALTLRLVSHPSAATPLQSPKPDAQVMTVQALALHPSVLTLAKVQAWPQVPQLAGSIAVFAQNCDGAVPQVESGGAQVVVHAPREHSVPAGQAVPQPPQLAASVCVLISHPFAAEWSQSA